MSKELQVLLQRITPVMEPIQEPPEPSRDQMSLIARINNRRWLTHEIPLTEENLEEARNNLKWIKHALNDPESLLLIQLGVERYMGSRCPWYLDISQGVDFDDEIWESLPSYFEGCPRATKYRIGSYGRSSDDTIRFIKDRLNWAQKLYKQEVRVIRKYLRALKKWDLESDLPLDSVFYID